MPLQGKLKWTSYPRISDTRHGAMEGLDGHTVTLVGDKVYVLGGYGRPNQALSIFSLSDRSWRSLSGIRYRYGHSCVLANDHLYVLGGGRDGSGQRTIEAYDLLVHSSRVVCNGLQTRYFRAEFLDSLGKIVLLAPISRSVFTFDVNTDELREYTNRTGHEPKSVGDIVQAGRQLFVTSNTQVGFELYILSLRVGLSAHWEKVETIGSGLPPQYRPGCHAFEGVVVLYGSATLAGDRTSELIIFDERSREMVSLGPLRTALFDIEGLWPSSGRKGTVASGGRLVVLKWTDQQDMVESEISMQ